MFLAVFRAPVHYARGVTGLSSAGVFQPDLCGQEGPGRRPPAGTSGSRGTGPRLGVVQVELGLHDLRFLALEERRLPLSRSGGEIASSCGNPIPLGGSGPLPDRGVDGAASATARQPLDHAPCFFVHHDVDTSSHAVPRCSIGCVMATHFREHGNSTAPPPRTRGHRRRDARTPVPVVGIQHSPIHAGGTVQNQGLSPGQG